MSDKTSDKISDEKASDKLLKCPFCGEKASLETISDLTRTEYVVCCDNKKCICFYIGYGDVGLYETKEKAITAWNQRKPMEKILERLNELKENAWDEEYQTMCDAIDIVMEEGGLNE